MTRLFRTLLLLLAIWMIGAFMVCFVGMRKARAGQMKMESIVTDKNGKMFKITRIRKRTSEDQPFVEEKYIEEYNPQKLKKQSEIGMFDDLCGQSLCDTNVSVKMH